MDNLRTCGAAGTMSVLGESGYDAVTDRGRRQPPRVQLSDEDTILPERDRSKLIATSRDIRRQNVLAGFLLRKHLDFVASFRFEPRTDVPAVNDSMERFILRWKGRANSDAARRHRFEKAIRLAEAMAVLDGDVLAHRLSNGLIQWIEGDRIRNVNSGLPRGFNLDQFVNGVRVDPRTRESRAFLIAKRIGRRFEYSTVLPARAVYHHGYFDRFDQVRGISPLAPAINSLVDTYEWIDYAMARAKVAQMFALAIKSEGSDTDGEVYSAEPTGDDDSQSKYNVDMGRGPIKLELEPGDEADFLESRQPAQEMQDFMTQMIQLVLKSLDLPMHFFDESRATWHGSRGGLITYVKSAKHKRDNVKEMLDSLTRWRFALAIAQGDLELPGSMTIDDLEWEWIADGTPFWNPVDEIRGRMMEVAAGVNTIQNIVHETGGGTGDPFKNIDENMRVIEYARQAGFPLTLPDASAFDPVTTAPQRGGDDE